MLTISHGTAADPVLRRAVIGRAGNAAPILVAVVPALAGDRRDLANSLVLSWLAQKWQRRCSKLAPRSSKNPEQYLTKEQQKACLDSAAAELIREITQRPPLH
jgi:hypothetical protein